MGSDQEVEEETKQIGPGTCHRHRAERSTSVCRVYSPATFGCKFAKSVGPREFLAEAFRDLHDGEHVVVAVIPHGTERWFQYAYAPHLKFDAAVATDAWYFCGSTSR